MAKVTIYGGPLSDKEISDLTKLLAKTGECEGKIDVLTAVTAEEVDHEDPVIVILGNEATCMWEMLEADLINAQASAQRAIWVWPKGATEGERPDAAKKYLYSAVPWDAAKLRDVLADDDVTMFESPTGTAIPAVQTDRNICVEEEKGKPK